MENKTKEEIFKWKKSCDMLFETPHINELQENYSLEELRVSAQLDQDRVETFISDLQGLL